MTPRQGRWQGRMALERQAAVVAEPLVPRDALGRAGGRPPDDLGPLLLGDRCHVLLLVAYATCVR